MHSPDRQAALPRYAGVALETQHLCTCRQCHPCRSGCPYSWMTPCASNVSPGPQGVEIEEGLWYWEERRGVSVWLPSVGAVGDHASRCRAIPDSTMSRGRAGGNRPERNKSSHAKPGTNIKPLIQCATDQKVRGSNPFVRTTAKPQLPAAELESCVSRAELLASPPDFDHGKPGRVCVM